MTILLALHIFLAIITLAIAALAATAAAKKRSASNQLSAMWFSFAGILLTGVGLFIITPESLGHLCALAAVYAVLLSGVHVYSKNPKEIAPSL